MFLDWGILPWAGAYDLGLGYIFMGWGIYPSVGVYFPGLWEIFLGWGYTPGLGYIPLSWDIYHYMVVYVIVCWHNLRRLMMVKTCVRWPISLWGRFTTTQADV